MEEFPDDMVKRLEESVDKKISLRDLLGDSPILLAYPQLADIPIYVVYNPDSNLLGEYSINNDKINLNVALASSENVSLDDTLVHEIQHAIQKIEGFSSGSNLYMVDGDADARNAKREIVNLQHRIADAIGKDVVIDGKADYMVYHDDLVEYVKNNTFTKAEQEALELLLEGGDMKVRDMSGITAPAKEKYEEIDSKASFDQYNRVMGEVEARNTSTRLGMTPEQRRATLLAETEDVAREDQIYMNILADEAPIEIIDLAMGAQSEAMEDIRYSLSDKQATAIIEAMKANADVAPEIELTPENWLALFGAEGVVSTPIGEVKMGDGQYQKLIDQKRDQYFGCIKPTLNDPDIILEEYDAKEGAERDTKMLFVKTFVKPNRGRYIHFASVTVRKDNLEVSISSHEVKEKKVKEKMHNDNVVHLKETLLDSEWRLIKHQNDGSDLVPTPSVISATKVIQNFENPKIEPRNSLRDPETERIFTAATENIGTYDTNNPDIHYSLSEEDAQEVGYRHSLEEIINTPSDEEHKQQMLELAQQMERDAEGRGLDLAQEIAKTAI